MINAIMFLLYIIFGAIIGAVYFYLTLKRDKKEADIVIASMVGLGWPIVAPFAFAFYFAIKLSERDDEK